MAEEEDLPWGAINQELMIIHSKETLRRVEQNDETLTKLHFGDPHGYKESGDTKRGSVVPIEYNDFANLGASMEEILK